MIPTEVLIVAILLLVVLFILGCMACGIAYNNGYKDGYFDRDSRYNDYDDE